MHCNPKRLPRGIAGDIKNELESALYELAAEGAAAAWSTPGDELTSRYGDDVIVIADFEGVLAVNGDLVDRLQALPRGYHEVPEGGYVPTTEEEVQVDFAIDRVARRLRVKPQYVGRVARVMKLGELYYTSVSGETSVYARKRKR